jgi:hypothetical protein
LNPADGTYLNEFRMHDGVDTSYTKFDRKPDLIDDSQFDKVVPPADVPYVGWAEPGEWFNITVDVSRSGIYAADFLYTSNRGGTIAVDVNGKDATGPLQITTTNDPADPLAWRQWHHWNLAPQPFRVHLNKGKNIFTVHILTLGNMNLTYFDFKSIRRWDGSGELRLQHPQEALRAAEEATQRASDSSAAHNAMAEALQTLGERKSDGRRMLRWNKAGCIREIENCR